MARFGRAFPAPRRLRNVGDPRQFHITSSLGMAAAAVVGLDGTSTQLLIVSVAPAMGTTSEGLDYPAGIGLYGPGAILTYDGPAMAGNLVGSAAAAPGDDGLGNDYPEGVMTPYLNLPDVPAPATPAGGCILYYSSGVLYALGPSGTPVALATT